MDIHRLDHLPIEKIIMVNKVRGGDVNDAYEITTRKQKYFLLVQPNQTKEFFQTEKVGLEDLAKAGITVPEVYAIGELQQDAYLLISFLEEGTQKNFPALAKLIAKMHHTYSVNSKFGYKYPHQGPDINFDNTWTDSWIELFVEKRLDKLSQRLIETKQWQAKQFRKYKEVRSIIVSDLQKQKNKPSLLHGDLWGGNHMFLKNGTPTLFDPAPFYGAREFDIGVTTSFNAYPKEFYEVYQKEFPMPDGYEKRLIFYRLYVFMVHLVKFGNVYNQSVNRTMQEILTSD